jgi:hypothetical protein
MSPYFLYCLHMCPTTLIWCYVVTFETVFFALDKSRDTGLQNGLCYAVFEEQWGSNSALNVDKRVISLLRKCPLNDLVPTGELFFVYTHCSHPLKPAPPISLRIHM